MNGSFTCEVLYKNSKALLIGNKGDGLKIMLHLMNEARLLVAFQSLGIIEHSVNYAYSYASERELFNSLLKDLPLTKKNLHDYEVEKNAIRALLFHTLNSFQVYEKLSCMKTTELTKKQKRLLKRSTRRMIRQVTLAKYYACEAAVILSKKAIQVLGGYGFSKEYPLERLHRDSFGPLLYEGTSQIQALTSLKDFLKEFLKNPLQPVLIFLGSFLLSKILFFFSFVKTLKYYYVLTRFYEKRAFLVLKSFLCSFSSKKLFDYLSFHGETLCENLSYIETLSILNAHKNKDAKRKKLFYNYLNLIEGRLESNYSQWKTNKLL